MLSIALSELRMLLRNRLVAACAILIPLGLGIVVMVQDTSSGTQVFAVLQLTMMIAMGVYITATTTLAARRQTLFLKRLRSGAVGDGSIIAGLVGPIVAISVVQVGIVLTALSITSGNPPQHAWLLVIAVLATEAMFTGFALATAGVTNSPEHAQVTTLPIFFLVVGVSLWVAFTGTEELGLLKRVLPGGAVAEMVQLAWSGGDLAQVGLLLAPTLGWAAVAVLSARVMFRWEPRA